MSSVPLRGVDADRAALLAVRAQPGARRSGLVGVHDGQLKLAVNAPPDAGRANEALLALAAKLFGLRPSAVTLVRGHSSRQKVLRLELALDEARRRLDALLSSP